VIKKLTKSQLSPTHASTKRKITDELKHNAGWYEVREGSPVEVQWANKTRRHCQLVPFPMTLNEPNPVFKVRPFFDAKYITNGYG